MPIRKDIIGRGWAFPFRFEAAQGRVALSSAEENIRENITLILGTRPGERQMKPDFGCRIHELLFAPDTSATAHMAQLYVKESLERWEPRIKILDVKSRSETSGSVRVEVKYRIISVGTVHSVSRTVTPVEQR